MKNTRWSLLFACLSFLGLLNPAHAADPAMPPTPSSAAILQDLKSFRTMATVLMVAAHPDDENTQLITYLARGRGYRMAYLSVTRGDGGQNLLGPEFDEELGLIRTEELLAARRLDAGQQFFTRAIDFGFSKRADETLKIWDREQVLADVVRVFRLYRPDVVITRFNPDIAGGVGTHGHHTSSAILARDAFKISGDPKSCPDQLTPAGGGLTVWQPKRIILNGGNQGATGTDPVLNESFNSIAARSRAMHKSQGFGGGGGPARGGPAPGGGGGGGGGGDGGGGGRGGGTIGTLSPQGFSLLGGDPFNADIMDGIDTTWNRIPGAGAEIASLTDDAIAQFKPENPAASIPALLAIRAKLTPLPSDPLVDDKRRQLDRILQNCLGLTLQTTVPQAEVVPGEVLKLHHTAMVTSGTPVKWLGVQYPASATEHGERVATIDLKAGVASSRDATTEMLSAGTPPSQPYWLRSKPAPGIYRVSDPTLIGRPENPPAFPVRFLFEVGGQTIIIPDEPIQASPGGGVPARFEEQRRLDVIAPVSLAFSFEVSLFAPGKSKQVPVELTAHRDQASGTLELQVPAGWKVEPFTQPFKLAGVGTKSKLSFNVTAPEKPASAEFIAIAIMSNGQRYSNERREIHYDHIPFLLLQPPAQLKAVALDMVTRGKIVGYVPGAGDSIAQCLEQMNYTVKTIDAKELNADNLKGLDALVIGVRAFDTRSADLAAAGPALTAFVEAGGNIIAQYNRNGAPRVGPLSVRVANIRTTDETAPPTFIAADHPALNIPNKITPADFDGWVQERGIYYPQTWDQGFTPILAFADPTEQPVSGSLLVAKQGKGYIVYTSLVFFRELPAGVPGAYRLFANLVSLGK